MKGLLSCTLLSFLINIPHSPASQAKLPHLYFFCNKPASPQHGSVFCLFFHSRPFSSTCRFSFCSEKCQWSTWRIHCVDTEHGIHCKFPLSKLAWQVRNHISSVPDSHLSSFLSLCLSEREPFIACSVAADKAGPFICGSHSESKTGKHLPQHLATINLHYPLH